MISRRATQYAIGSLLFFFAGVAVAAFSFYQISQEGELLERRMEVIGKNKLMQHRHTELLSMLKKQETEHEELASHLLTKEGTIHFLSEIETLARNSNLTFTTNSLEVKPLPNPAFETIDLKLQAEGERADIVAFLTVLETLPYFSRINDLKLVAAKRATGQVWTATISLTVALHAYDK